MTKKYYWAGPLDLQPGSIVEPGNWYRIVSSVSGHYCALREEVCEWVRRDLYPDLPSRTRSIFLCETEEGLRGFLQENPRPLDILYEVELLNPDANVCKVNSDLTRLQNADGSALSILEHEEQARNYWESSVASHISHPEIIAESAIRVVRKI